MASGRVPKTSITLFFILYHYLSFRAELHNANKLFIPTAPQNIPTVLHYFSALRSIFTRSIPASAAIFREKSSG